MQEILVTYAQNVLSKQSGRWACRDLNFQWLSIFIMFGMQRFLVVSMYWAADIKNISCNNWIIIGFAGRWLCQHTPGWCTRASAPDPVGAAAGTGDWSTQGWDPTVVQEGRPHPAPCPATHVTCFLARHLSHHLYQSLYLQHLFHERLKYKLYCYD